jgi:hypothetical protein
MTAAAPPRLRTVAFGEADGSLWGGALDAGTPALVFGAGGVGVSVAGSEAIAWSQDYLGWRLEGEGFELLVSPARDGESDAEPIEELCHVTGRLVVDGAEHTVECVGTRSLDTGLDIGDLESVRAVSGWFRDGDAMTLVALRPLGGRGQEDDLLLATVFEPGATVAVGEARLSTTYGPGGLPARATLELWIGEGEEQFPRRAAGEALAGAAEACADGVRLQVTPLRCHSRGLDGAGVYLLARF